MNSVDPSGQELAPAAKPKRRGIAKPPHVVKRAEPADTLPLEQYIPAQVGKIRNHQLDLPRIARDKRLTALIHRALQRIPTSHDIYHHDARDFQFIPDSSVHLVLTSPPYWTLKEYRRSPAQLGFVSDYEAFLAELDRVWTHCMRVLVPGGRLIVVVGDVCLSRRRNNGRHTVVPLHAAIQEHCRKLGFDNLQGIVWHKIANAKYEVENGSGFLGKPYEPNAVIKNDVEYVLMQRKPGGYRSPSVATRVLSVISSDDYQSWFRMIWEGVTGASTKHHPAPYPVELAERLVRMFSFVGDTVLDPFMGTGTTTVAAAKCARHSIGLEVDVEYFNMARCRILEQTKDLFSHAALRIHGNA